MSQPMAVCLSRSPVASDLFNVKDDAGVVQELNTPNVEVENDSTFYTSRKLLDILTLEEYRVVSTSLTKFAELDCVIEDSFFMLRTTGIPFNDPKTRGMIQFIGGAEGWSQEIMTKLYELGIKYTSVSAQVFGRSVTLDDVINYRQYVDAEVLRDTYSSVWSNISTVIRTGNKDDVITALKNGIEVLNG